MKNHTIKEIYARQILDSRGNPTIEAQILLNSGITATAAVPSGASTGQYEAIELRDEADIYCGKSVFKAIANIKEIINEELKDYDIFNQSSIDHKLIDLDGTENKSNLGANATLAVSLAAARTAAVAAKMPLYRYLGGAAAMTMPVPMLNVLNGGAHANNNVEIQEFMIVPIGAPTFTKAMEMSMTVYHALGHILKESGLGTTVGDEGGFAPNLENDEQALKLLIRAIERTGLTPGKDIAIALDAAASEWKATENYQQPKSKRTFTTAELIQYFGDLIKNYPIISLEDPLGDDDFEGFAQIRKETNIQIVGDDLFVTNSARLKKGISKKSGNAILIKPNQIGTLSETLETIRIAKTHGYKTIISHRSGETADPFIADLAVAVNAGQIKTGAPARSERVCKYNRLMGIEQVLGIHSYYPGSAAFL
ncbi:MAG: phosphopyruvate hydratase [Clostridia bacterium]|nr:phosphopyruvate hydratase [Clostridia bacterium]